MARSSNAPVWPTGKAKARRRKRGTPTSNATRTESLTTWQENK